MLFFDNQNYILLLSFLVLGLCICLISRKVKTQVLAFSASIILLSFVYLSMGKFYFAINHLIVYFGISIVLIFFSIASYPIFKNRKVSILKVILLLSITIFFILTMQWLEVESSISFEIKPIIAYSTVMEKLLIEYFHLFFLSGIFVLMTMVWVVSKES